jgi:hypothetical protein
MELVRDCGIVIERIYTTSTVIGTQEYAFPTNALSIKRVTYNGKKLAPYSLREDDIITLSNEANADQGEPTYYYTWNNSIYLRPIPVAVQSLKVYSINQPQAIETTSTLEVPVYTHMNIVDYIVSQMAAKDMNFETAQYYRQLWDGHKMQIQKKMRLMKQGDAFGVVKVEELIPITTLGNQ